MITERTSGHSIRGSARRSGLLASQSMSPCAPDSRKLRKYFAASAIAAGSATPTQSKPSASACCFSDSIESELTGNPLKRKSFFVSRTRCSVLHAAPQSRDPRYYHIRRWAPAQQRIASRCAASGARYPSYSEVEIHIGGRRRHARQPFAQQRAERRAGFHPRVPRLCRVVLDPWHVAQIIGDDSGAGNRRLAFRYQYRRGAGRVQRKKRLTALPGPLFGQPQIEAVFAERQADEARMRAERMMEQGEHGGLEYFAMLKNLSTPETAPTYRSAQTRQPVF